MDNSILHQRIQSCPLPPSVLRGQFNRFVRRRVQYVYITTNDPQS